MHWFFIAFGSAVTGSLKTLFSKKSLPKMDEYIVTWALRFYSLPVLVPLLFFVEWPSTGWFYWLLLTIVVALKTFIIILFMRAIKIADLSLVAPLITFTPLFLLFTSPLMINEFPDRLGIAGILLIVFGTYLLNSRLRKESLLRPIKALFQERGARLMLLVTFLWSITTNLDKVGVRHASPVFWSVTTNVFSALLMFPVLFWKARQPLTKKLLMNKKLFLIGFFAAFSNLLHMIAIQFALVAYVMSVKRLSAAMNVCYGYFIFNEKQFAARLIGSVIMILGALLLTF